jgi:predicted O-methyltransferase YrrM
MGTPTEQAAIAGALARDARWLADVRVKRALRGVRRAVKADRRPCPDEAGKSFGEIMWSPKPWWCERFYDTLRAVRPGLALEVGTSLGMTSLYLLAAMARNRLGRLVTVDVAPSKAAYARALFDAFGADRVTSLLGRSENVLPAVLADTPLFDWVFVDIDHRYASTVAHWHLLAEHVRPGGYIVFDDINFGNGMRRAWREVSGQPGFAWTTLHWHDRPEVEARIGIGQRLPLASAAYPAAASRVQTEATP